MSEQSSSSTFSISSWIVLVLIALLPFAFSNAYSSFEVFRQGLVVGLSSIALVSWGVDGLFGAKIKLSAGRVSVLLLAFILYAVISIGWTEVPYDGVLQVAHLLALGAIAIILASPTQKPIEFRHLAISVSVGAGLAAVFGILDLVGIGKLLGQSIFTPVWDPAGPTGAFDSMENAVSYYVLALPIILSGVFEFESKRRWLSLTSFILVGFHFSTMATWTAAGIFAATCLVTVIIFFIFQEGESTFSLYPLVVLLGIVAVFMAVVHSNVLFSIDKEKTAATSLPHLAQVSQLTDKEISGKQVRNPIFSIGRYESITPPAAYEHIFVTGADLYTERPVFGHGPASWWYLQTKHPNTDSPYAQGMFDLYPAFRSPHNGIIKLAVEFGLTGLFLFIVWIIAIFAITFSAIGSNVEPAEKLLDHWGLFTAAIAGVVFSMFTPLIEFASSSLLWFAVLGLLTRHSAQLNDLTGWSAPWTITGPESRGTAWMGIAVILGLATLIPAASHSVASYYRGQGDNFMVHTYFRQAIEEYQQSTAWYPQQGEVLYNIGLANIRKGTPGDAGSAIRTAANLRPYDSRSQSLLAYYELQQENNIEALEAAKPAVRYNSNNPDAVKNYAAALQNNHQYDKAVNEMLDFLKKDPPDQLKQTFHRLVAEIYSTQIQNYSKAEKHYQKVLKMLPKGSQQKRIKKRLKRIEAKLQKQRRKREGKPPKKLEDAAPGGMPGHQH
jgi:Tfp pilus assembly protein PilF